MGKPRLKRRRAARIVTAWALVALVASATPLPAFAATASGRVVMGTAGAPLPPDLRVTVLENSVEGQAQGQPNHVPVAPDGAFSFEADPAKGHLIGMFFGGVAYSRVLEPGKIDGIELEVFETTDDPSVVKVASDTMTILQSRAEGQSDVLEVLQLLRFRNDTDRSFVGPASDQPAPSPQAPEAPEEPRRILRLPLPESAFDLMPADPGNGAGLATVGGRLVTTSALVPGETSVAYLFKVKVPRSGWQLRREVYYPTDHADLLISKRLELGAGPRFRFAESKSLGGEDYNRYRAGALNPGAVVEADIVFASSESSNGVWLGLATVVAVVGALFFGGSIRTRRRRAAEAPAAASDDAAGRPDMPTREELIEQVAALDEKFEAGGLDSDAYRAQRSTLLARLSTPAENS